MVSHPEVVAPRQKELHFFSDARSYRRGIEYYAQQFDGDSLDKFTGEFTPAYMFVRESASRIRRWLPQVKIVACLRDPVRRAFSQYKYSIQLSGRLSYYPTFEEAVDNDHELFERGMYGRQLKEYYDRFPDDNILVLFHDDVQARPSAVIRDLYRFIGLSDLSFVPPRAGEQMNATANINIVERLPHVNQALYRVRHMVPAGSGLERLATSSGVATLARRVIRVNRRRDIRPAGSGTVARAEPSLRQETVERLRAAYAHDGKLLERLVSREVPWLGQAHR